MTYCVAFSVNVLWSEITKPFMNEATPCTEKRSAFVAPASALLATSASDLLATGSLFSKHLTKQQTKWSKWRKNIYLALDSLALFENVIRDLFFFNHSVVHQQWLHYWPTATNNGRIYTRINQTLQLYTTTNETTASFTENARFTFIQSVSCKLQFTSNNFITS